MKCTFFVYAFHFIPVRFVNKLAARILPGSSAAAVFLFLTMPAIGYGLSWAAALVLKRWFPRLWELLNGGR